jgi:hypothetical protein
MTGPLQHPTSELVVAAWIAGITPIPSSMIATQPPQDVTKWTSFVPPGATYTTTNIQSFVAARVIGGTPQLNVPVRKPVAEIKCYATNPNSDKPPWFMANQLAELIVYACYNRMLYEFSKGLTVSTGNTNYNPANVMAAIIHTEPRRLYGDVRNYAVYQMDVGFTWREVGLTIQ